MSKKEKTLDKWRTGPVAVDKEEVFSILKRYHFEIDKKSGSHVIVHHDKLAGKPDFGMSGEFTFPVSGGQKVKGFYLKRILEAIDIISED